MNVHMGWLYAVCAVGISSCTSTQMPSVPHTKVTTVASASDTPSQTAVNASDIQSSPNLTEETATNEVAALQEQVKLLEHQVLLLQEHLQQLTRQQSGMNQSIRVIAQNENVKINTTQIDQRPLKQDTTYARAYEQYQRKKYQQAIQILKPYASGGNGSAEAINGMYLLMLSHKQLKQCESTIAIGRQFQQRFPNHVRAAEALYSVGQCQYDMQQQDIARETWKRVRVLYPHSAAAKQAAQQLR